MDDTDVTEKCDEKRVNACVGSQKVKDVRSDVTSKLGDIIFWYFSPNNYIEKQECKYIQNNCDRNLKMYNLIQKSSVRSSKKSEKSSIDYKH